MIDARYPIGKFHYDGPPSEAQRASLINDIEQTPTALRAAVKNLTSEQLDTPYREGGWTLRQGASTGRPEPAHFWNPPSRFSTFS